MVIVRKKTGEIRLCIDFRKLNAISIRDSFPLPRIEEALQAVQAAMWFTSFDLAQGYLQMAMEEADIPKTAFRAGSTDFTNSSECHLVSQMLVPRSAVSWRCA